MKKIFIIISTIIISFIGINNLDADTMSLTKHVYVNWNELNFNQQYISPSNSNVIYQLGLTIDYPSGGNYIAKFDFDICTTAGSLSGYYKTSDILSVNYKNGGECTLPSGEITTLMTGTAYIKYDDLYGVTQSNHTLQLYVPVRSYPITTIFKKFDYRLMTLSEYQSELNNEKLDDLNKNQQETNEKLDETNKNLENINDTLNDDTPPSADISSLGNVQGLLPPGPLDSLLNIPFYFLSVITTSLSGTCTPLTGDFVFDSTLTIPCFGDEFYDDVPPGLMIFLSTIPSAFMLIQYYKHLYKKVDRAVSMETTSDDEWGVL